MKYPVLSVFMTAHLVVATIDNEYNSNEIPTEEREADVDDNRTNPNYVYDVDEVSIFSEESEFEEIKSMSMRRYIPFSEEIYIDDESLSGMSNNDDEFEGKKEDSPSKSSQIKSKKRKKRQATCTNQPTFNCDPKEKYRRINGTCNNLEHPDWGMAMGCQERLLKARYFGRSDFRKSVTGRPLPEPRKISLNINTDECHPDKEYNQMSMFQGQYFAHEMVLTPLYALATGEILPCCNASLENDPRCANVYTKKNDPFYGPLNHTCMDDPRSIICNSCDEYGDRKIMNLNTPYIDASIVYGSQPATTDALRRKDGSGKLKSQFIPGVGEMLPNSTNPDHDQCSVPDRDRICFKGGDARANQHIVITILQTIWLRLHNKIAERLKALNPSWSDETIFQETRRIIAALIQIIFYKEYIWLLLSPYWIEKYGLALSNGYTEYNKTVNGAMLVEYSTAAFRIQHSAVNTNVSKVPRNVTEGETELRSLYTLPFGLRHQEFSRVLKDLTEIPAQKIDRHSVPDVNNYLYRIPGDPGGLDLSSIDIQRGRDHGLPTYVDMLHYCHGVKITSFKDPRLLEFLSLSIIQLFEKNYECVEDVDLETALQAEKKEGYAMTGKTSACIISKQIYNIKYGDRYHCEHKDQAGSFTEDQLKELKKFLLSTLFCLTVPELDEVNKYAMLLNCEKIKCKDVEDLDLSAWKE